MRTSDGLTVINAEERERFGPISRLVEARDTGGRWSAVIVEATRSDRPVQTHVHPGEPEAFFILSGELDICGSESATPVGPGSFILVPPGVEHAFRLRSDSASWLAIWPASLDGLLEEVAAARADGRADRATLEDIGRRHGTNPGRILDLA